MSINDSDIYHCYVDFLKGPSERFAIDYHCIGKDNMNRIGAADDATNEEDQTIAIAFRKRFCIQMDFELLESHMPFNQARQARL